MNYVLLEMIVWQIALWYAYSNFFSQCAAQARSDLSMFYCTDDALISTFLLAWNHGKVIDNWNLLNKECKLLEVIFSRSYLDSSYLYLQNNRGAARIIEGGGVVGKI